MEAFNTSTTQLIAEVDCTGPGETLCSEFHIQGYPTLLWGDPHNLQDYRGKRDYDTLQQFAQEHLQPQCSPTRLELCDEHQTAEIVKYQAMGYDQLSKIIVEQEHAMHQAEQVFMDAMEELNRQYEQAIAEKDAQFEMIREEEGLRLMKFVVAMKIAKEKLSQPPDWLYQQ